MKESKRRSSSKESRSVRERRTIASHVIDEVRHSSIVGTDEPTVDERDRDLRARSARNVDAEPRVRVPCFDDAELAHFPQCVGGFIDACAHDEHRQWRRAIREPERDQRRSRPFEEIGPGGIAPRESSDVLGQRVPDRLDPMRNHVGIRGSPRQVAEQFEPA